MSETTFKHTTARVPRLYKEAAKIVQKVKEEGGSFKGLVFQSKHRSLKSLYALVAETLRHASDLDALLRHTQLLFKEPRLDPWLARVLITELLWRQRPLAGSAIPLKIILNYKSQLQSKHADLPSQLTPSVSRASRPRYVRINTLKSTKEDILDFFQNEGWREIKISPYSDGAGNKYDKFLAKISTLSTTDFMQDMHVNNLLVFPGNMEFYNLHLYHNGSLLLQDKASCMSAHLLDAPPGSTVLDMCAAPGMKTTHIAATINNEGVLYAVEKHQDRYESLCRVVSQAGASCVKPILGNSLDFTHKDLPNVEYIVVDPTCSGSGMINRREIFTDENDVSKLRLEKLSGFQSALLRHAMTNFPDVKRIVYSTCSLCPEENEAVVENVLNTTPPNFKPIMITNGTEWMSRGSSSYTFGNFGLYARPNVDYTNGFFVVVFQRTDNEYISGKMDGSQDKTQTEDLPLKKKKKKEKKIPSDTTREAVVNPALERMKKAMQNFKTFEEKAVSVNNMPENFESSDSPKSNESQTSKKRKSTQVDEPTLNLDEKILVENGLTKKKKKKKKDGSENLGDNGINTTPIPLCENEKIVKLGKKKKKRRKEEAD